MPPLPPQSPRTQFHVLSYEPGGHLADKLWQAPAYCFSTNASADHDFDFREPLATGRMFRMQPATERSGGAPGGGSAGSGPSVALPLLREAELVAQ